MMSSIDAPHFSNEKTYLLHFMHSVTSFVRLKLFRQIGHFLFDSIQCPFIDSLYSKFIFEARSFIDPFIHFYSLFVFLDIFFFHLQLSQTEYLLFYAMQVRKFAENPMANMLKKTSQTIEQLQTNKINAAAIVIVVVSFFFIPTISSPTMDYLCKLIESNKNTRIVKRCLPLNYREISSMHSMHSPSIWNMHKT